MNNKTILKAAAKNITRWHKTLSALAINKQVSRRCANFSYELTCKILTNHSIKIGHSAWSTSDHSESKVASFPTCKNWLNFRVRGQFEIKILLLQLMNTTYFLCISKNWTWTCDHLKTINLSAGNLKKYSTSMGRYLSPLYGQVDTGQRIPCFDSCQLITTWICDIRLYLGSQTTIYG